MDTQNTVKKEVIELLNTVSHMNVAQIMAGKKEGQETSLIADLLIDGAALPLLAPNYTAISRKYGGGVIKRSIAGKLDTVQKVIGGILASINNRTTKNKGDSHE